MPATDWFLRPSERGNEVTLLDRRHASGRAWTSGNEVIPLVHGATYFAVLLEAIQAMRAGDLFMFTDWRGDPDERLDGGGHEIGSTLSRAAASGVLVRGLIWRSHLDRLQFSERENRHLGEQVNAAGGVCLLDMRVRPGGSHHQKFAVLRHPNRPDLDRAFVGGIDLCHSRRDDATHAGDEQRQALAAAYGPRPPWHDIQLQLRGPAVGDVETVFRERWDDPTPLSYSPIHLVRDRLDRLDPKRRALPMQLPDPEPCGVQAVQLLRTYPRRWKGYPFAPRGERSVARGIDKALGRARQLIYVEDQYLWSSEVALGFCQALRTQPDLLLIAVIPRYADKDGRFSNPPNVVGRLQALRTLFQAGGDRVAVYGLENHQGTPVYVHAKVCIVDDAWASVGSDNINRRSWTHDSELSCAVVEGAETSAAHGAPRQPFALELRLALAREHLDWVDGDDGDLVDPRSAFSAFEQAAGRLEEWHSGAEGGERPPGRLRRYAMPDLSKLAEVLSLPFYRAIFDPDARSRSDRAVGRF